MKMPVVLFFILLFSVKIDAQRPDIVKKNFISLDAEERHIRDGLCYGSLLYDTGAKYNQQYFKVVKALNAMTKDDFSLSSLDTVLKKIGNDTVFRSQKDNGGIKIIDLRIPNEGFYVDVRLESIDGLLVRKKYIINAQAYLNCNKTLFKYPNFPLLKQVVKEANYLIRFVNDEIWSDSLNYANIEVVGKGNGQYRIVRHINGAEAWVNEILEDQFRFEKGQYYNFKRPERHFALLIRGRKYEVIDQLLYSPNYFFAINAMEALIYLDHTGEVKLTPAERERMVMLKDERNAVMEVLGGDVGQTVHGYRGLETNDETVIVKYSSLGRRQK